MLRELLFVALVVAVAWVLIFQLLLPWFHDMPFFPIFRSREIRDLEDDIAIVRQEQAIDDLEDRLDHEGQKLKPAVPRAEATKI